MPITSVLSIIVAFLATGNFGLIMYHHFATQDDAKERRHALVQVGFIAAAIILMYLGGGMFVK